MADVWSLFPYFLFLTALSVADNDHGENVVQYTKETFAKEIKTSPHFIMFFAPWCGHCKRLAPTFDQLALKHNVELKKKQVTIAKVDCTDQTALCSDHSVTGYPTLKFFNGDADPIKYSGHRTLEALDKFIEEQLKGSDQKAETGDVPTDVEVTDGLYILTDKTFEDAIAKGHTFVKFFAPWCGHCKKLAPTWDALAKEYEDTKDVRIAKVDCTQHGPVCHKNGVKGYPTLILFKDGEKVEQYQGGRDQSALSNFVKTKTRAPDKETEKTAEKVPDKRDEEKEKKKEEIPEGLLILTDKTFESTTAKGHTFIKFFAPWCGHCKRLAPTWDALAEQYKNNKKIKIAKVDCTQFSSICKTNGVRGYPTLLLFKDGNKIDEYRGSREHSALSEYINKKCNLEGEAQPEKEEEKPEKEEEEKPEKEEEEKPEKEEPVEGLTILTASNFEEILHEEHALVKFYAPWCPHCKALAPVWDELAKEYIGHDNVIIGKVDCTVHRKLCSTHEVKGYPTLYYFHNGKRTEKYTGTRDLRSLIRFMDKKLLTVTDKEREALKAADVRPGTQTPRDGTVIHLNSKTFEKEIAKGYTFVKFFAPWCGHCKALAPTWAKLSDSFKANANIKIAKVDCTLEESLCEKQEIDGFPTLFLYRNGKKLGEHDGERDLKTLRKYILDQVPHDEL